MNTTHELPAPEPITVDSRFGGGPLAVAPVTRSATTLVAIVGPGFSLEMFAHEARALADALAKTASITS